MLENEAQMAGATQTTTARERSERDRPAPQSVLRWVWPELKVHRLQGARVRIGRDDTADIRVEGASASRLHAELYRQGPLYVLRDLGSTNGTWLAGQNVEHAPIAPGKVLRIGDWIGVFGESGSDDCDFGELAPGIYGGSEIARLLAPLQSAATSNLPVLLVGATGTGKERLARAVHHFSGRRGPFVAVNCAALPEQLAEGELFGYRRGAFTGAERGNLGHFRVADGGTLFLDEMPELSPALQAKLLRVVEDGQVQGLGEASTTAVDVRIVAASQKPPADLVAQDRLRQDLAARLSGLELRLPPLSERRADVAPLFAQFLHRHSGGRPPEVEPRLIEALSLHDWPQNVRELEMLTRSVLAVHGHEQCLKLQHLPAAISSRCQARGSVRRSSPSPRERADYELSRLEEELERTGGNIKAAAEALGISRQRVYRLLDTRIATNGAGEGAGNDDDVRP